MGFLFKLTIVGLGLIIAVGIWRIVAALDTLGAALKTASDPAGQGLGKDGKADQGPLAFLRDLNGKFEELTKAVWALQSLSDRPVEAPFGFNAVAQQAERDQRVADYNAIKTYVETAFYFEHAPPEEMYVAFSQAKDRTQDLFAPAPVYTNLMLVLEAILMGSRAGLLLGNAEGKPPVPDYLIHNAVRGWQDASAMMESRLAEDRAAVKG